MCVALYIYPFFNTGTIINTGLQKSQGTPSVRHCPMVVGVEFPELFSNFPVIHSPSVCAGAVIPTDHSWCYICCSVNCDLRHIQTSGIINSVLSVNMCCNKDLQPLPLTSSIYYSQKLQ